MLKKFFDLVVVLIFLPIWFPLIIITIILSYIFNGRPIFFFNIEEDIKIKKFRLLNLERLIQINKLIFTVIF